MPAGVDEEKWSKAKEIAEKSDNCPDKGTDDYWAYVQGVYKNMNSKTKKTASEVVNDRLRKMADEYDDYREYTYSDKGEGRYSPKSHKDSYARSIGRGVNLDELGRETFRRLAPNYDYDKIYAGTQELPEDSEASRRLHNYTLKKHVEGLRKNIPGFESLPKFTRQRMFDAYYRGGDRHGLGPKTTKLFNSGNLLKAIEEFRNRKDLRNELPGYDHYKPRLDRTTKGMSRFVRSLRDKGWKPGEDWREYTSQHTS